MAIIRAKRIWDSISGLNQAATPVNETFQCGGQTPEVGYLEPQSNCCSDYVQYIWNPSSAVSANASVIYGVAIFDDNGNTIVIDVQGDNETSTATTDATDLTGKITKISVNCNCTDCTGGTVFTATGVYNGTFPSASAASVCYTVARTDDGTDVDIEKIKSDYYNLLTVSPVFVSRTGGATTYKLSFSAVPPQIAGDTFTSTTC
jgi:hypothetical protein